MHSDEAEVTSGDGPTIEQVRTRRQSLRDAMVAVEEAVARPAGQGEGWAQRVHEALLALSVEFERHIASTEAPGGLFEAVQGAAPRLAGPIERLVHEHQHIRSAIGQGLDAVRPRAHPFGPADAAGGRDAVLELVNQLLRHRQAGADLIYEAFETDIGVGD